MTESRPPADDLETPAGDPSALVDVVEKGLLGGERKYTRVEVAEHAGVDVGQARDLWRALGFATVEDDDRVFTDSDIQALRHVSELKAIGNIDDEVMHAMTRVIGQTFARLASWQGQVVLDAIAADPALVAGGADGVADLIAQITPLTDELHSYVWRRQLTAYLTRVASNAGVTAGAESAMVVGFVDMAGFTTLTRNSSEGELRTVLTAFETAATDIVAGNRGQIVKTIGDEILFVCDDPRTAVEIALSLIEHADRDPVLPQVRAGLAFGPVVSRLGDVFGQTVNIASRLTTLARTDSVLVDEGMRTALADDDRVELRPLRPTSVRGYHHLKSWRVRRTRS